MSAPYRRESGVSGFRYVSITDSVGKDGANRHHDVGAVQELINAHLPVTVRRLHVDGMCGPFTIEAIREVERQIVGMHDLDGRIDPHGRTMKALNNGAAPRAKHPILYSSRTSALRSAGPRARLMPSSSPTKPSSARKLAAATSHSPGIPSEIVAAAQAAQTKWNVPASISIAQWILESGSGRHMPPGSNNPFGIKAGKGEPAIWAWTKEQAEDKRVIRIKAPFRKFDSLADAFEAHGKLLATHPAYKLARQYAGDPDGYADALTRHYATDWHYGTLLMTIMKDNGLYQYN